MRISIDGRRVSKKDFEDVVLDDSKRLESWIVVNGVKFYASSFDAAEKSRIYEATKAFEKLARAARKISWEE